MSDIVYKTHLLGNYKTIVGDGKSDLVLNTLGKVYIKTGNSLKLINDIIALLNKINEKPENEILKSVIITDNIESLEYPGDGKLIFNSSNETLYISYKEKYILLFENLSDLTIETPNEPERAGLYVKKTGDTMSGTLRITSPLAPLIVSSKQLNTNFNAEYINGYNSNKLAIKEKNENILGLWTYENEIIAELGIRSPEFASGFTGYGWRMDPKGVLTVDSLIVRKALHVYELVINKIRATNGSLWITDSQEISKIYDVRIFPENDDPIPLLTDVWYIRNYDIGSVEINKTNYDLIEDSILNDFTGLIYLYYYNYLFRIKDIPSNSLNLITRINDKNCNLKNIPEIEVFDLFADKPNIENLTNLKFFYEYKKDLLGNDYANKYYKLFSTGGKRTFNGLIRIILPYYKYFASSHKNPTHIKVVSFKDKVNYFQPFDIIRCLKIVSSNRIKYYDAIVAAVSDYTDLKDEQRIVLIKGRQIFDKYQEPSNENLNLEQENDNIDLDTFAVEDTIVRIGNILNKNRQNSVYLSSSEFYSPYVRVLDGIKRPDYNVCFRTPDFDKVYYNSEKYPERNGWYFYTSKTSPIAPNTRIPEPNKESWVLGTLHKQIEIDGYIYNLSEYPTIGCIIKKDSKGNYKSIVDNPLKVQLGNLNGINSDIYPSLKGYGLYGENVYLTGEFHLNNGQNIIDVAKNYVTSAINANKDFIDNITNSLEHLSTSNYKLSLEKLCNISKNRLNKIFKSAVRFNHSKYKEYLLEKTNIVIQEEKDVNYLIDRIQYLLETEEQIRDLKPIVFKLSEYTFYNKSTDKNIIILPEDKKDSEGNILEEAKVTKLENVKYLKSLYITHWLHWINEADDEISRLLSEPTKYYELDILYILSDAYLKKVKEIVDTFYNYCKDILKNYTDFFQNSNKALHSAGIKYWVETNTKTGYLALWGDKIAFYTKKDEINGETSPTLFMEDGYISAKLIKFNCLLGYLKVLTSNDTKVNPEKPKYEIHNSENPIITINDKGLGESIIYWPGTKHIMNCKVLYSNMDGIINGCVEYFFKHDESDGIFIEDVYREQKVSEDVLLNLVPELIETLSWVPRSDLESTEKYKKYLVKKFNYFQVYDFIPTQPLSYYGLIDEDEWNKSFEGLNVYGSNIREKLKFLHNNPTLAYVTLTNRITTKLNNPKPLVDMWKIKRPSVILGNENISLYYYTQNVSELVTKWVNGEELYNKQSLLDLKLPSGAYVLSYYLKPNTSSNKSTCGMTVLIYEKENPSNKIILRFNVADGEAGKEEGFKPLPDTKP